MTTKTENVFEPDYAVPPGESLRETIEALGMSQKELSKRTGLTDVSINRILSGVQPLTYETANKLELATGVPANLWNNLEAQYREQLAKLKEQAELEKQASWLKRLPVRELQQRGYISTCEDKPAMVREALAFYGTSSVESWEEIWETPKLAARRSTCFETQIGATSAWIRQGELRAHKITCAPYDKKKFQKALEEIRKLTTKKPEVFEPEMKRLCSEAGVAMVLVREMKKVPWNGATKWMNPDKAMIILNIRGKGEDRFWFTFFHEASHVLNDSKKHLFINDGKGTDPNEIKADAFAADFLIPVTYDDEIRKAHAAKDIRNIARELELSPGIVAGRYQHLTKKWSWHTELIRKLEWANKE